MDRRHGNMATALGVRELLYAGGSNATAATWNARPSADDDRSHRRSNNANCGCCAGRANWAALGEPRRPQSAQRTFRHDHSHFSKTADAFSIMRREGGFGDPLLYVLILGTAAMLISLG